MDFGIAQSREGLTLEQRVQRQEDLEDIKRLRDLYHIFINAKQFDKVIELYSDDPVFSIDGLVSFEGRAAVDRGFRETGESIKLVKQFVAQHVIDIDGDTARGIADLEARYASDGISIMASGRYFEDYVRTDKGWRIQKTHTVGFFTVPLDVGWAGEKLFYVRAEGTQMRAER